MHLGGGITEQRGDARPASSCWFSALARRAALAGRDDDRSSLVRARHAERMVAPIARVISWSMVRGTTGWFALLLVACGSSDRPHVVGLADGTFLEARYYEADGVHVFRGWHDTGLDISCAFQVASDGRYRCLPAEPDVGYTGTEFGDASCTLPILLAPACEVPRFALGVARPTPLCGEPSGRSVLAVGAARASSTFYRSEEGVCTPYTAPAGLVVHDLSGRIDADDFIAAELATTTTNALAPYAYVASDGAIHSEAIWDTARAAECRPNGENDGENDALHCEPVEIAFFSPGLWADGACTIPATGDFGYHRPCGRPTAVMRFDQVVSYSEIGAEVLPANVHVNDTAGGCTLAPPERLDGARAYQVGAPLPIASLPAISQVLDGDGRLRAMRYTDAEGHALTPALRFHDTLIDAACWPLTFDDGVTRCTPSYTQVSPPHGGGTYADSACTQPVIYANLEGPPPALALIARERNNSCEPGGFESARTSGSLYEGPLFGGAQCISIPRDPAYRYFTLGAPVELPVVRAL